MPQIAANHLDTLRGNISQSLNEITNDIGMDLRDAGLMFPLYITVPTSGNALAMIATPFDPSDQDREQARMIVNGIIEQRLGCGKLRARELTCAVANATPMA